MDHNYFKMPVVGLLFRAAKAIPIAPANLGTGELAAIAMFGLIGINAAAAFTIATRRAVVSAMVSMSKSAESH